MAALIKCPKRVVVDGRLAAFEGQMITEEEAKRLGLLEIDDAVATVDSDAPKDPEGADAPKDPEGAKPAKTTDKPKSASKRQSGSSKK